MSENGDDKNDGNRINKKKSLSLNMGDISGKVVKKEATPKGTKTEGKKKKEEKKCNCSDCSCKTEAQKIKTVSFAEDEEAHIQLNISGKKIKLEDITQKDFLGWVYNVMPMTKKKFEMLQKSDFSKFKERQKLFETVVKFHEDTLKEDLKNKGYSGFPLV